MIDTLDSSTPLRCAQNDSDGVAFSSLESGTIVKCLSQSLPRRADRGRQNEIATMTQPRLPVIPSAARNLKSFTTRPVSQCHVYLMTNSGKQRENSPGRLYVVIDILDSSTTLRCAQNDSDGVAFSSLESGSIVKCLPLSALGERLPIPISPPPTDRLPIPISPAGGETSYPNLSPGGERHRDGGLRNSTHRDRKVTIARLLFLLSRASGILADDLHPSTRV